MANNQLESYKKAVEQLTAIYDERYGSNLSKEVKEIGSLFAQTSYQEDQSNQELEAFKKLNLTERGKVYKEDPEKYKKLNDQLGKDKYKF